MSNLKFVSYTSNLLEQMYDFQKCTMFLQKRILNPQHLPQKRSLETFPACIVLQYYPHNNIVCMHMYDECKKSTDSGVCHSMIFALLTSSSPSRFRGAPRGDHLPIRARSHHDQLHGPIRFPQHLFSVHDHGRQRSDKGPQHTFLPLRRPDCTLSRLRAEEYDRPVTQSVATPESSSRTIPTLDRTLVARWSLECVTTLGSRRSCPG